MYSTPLDELSQDKDLAKILDVMGIMTYYIIDKLPDTTSKYRQEVLFEFERMFLDRWSWWKAAWERISQDDSILFDPKEETSCRIKPREQLASLEVITAVIDTSILPVEQRMQLITLLTPLCGIEVCAYHTAEAISQSLLRVGKSIKETKIEKEQLLIDALFGEIRAKIIKAIARTDSMAMEIAIEYMKQVSENIGIPVIFMVMGNEPEKKKSKNEKIPKHLRPPENPMMN